MLFHPFTSLAGLGAVLSILLASVLSVKAESLHWQIGDGGLERLSYLDSSVEVEAGARMEKVVFDHSTLNEQGQYAFDFVEVIPELQERSWDAAAATETLRYQWGRVILRHRLEGERMELEIEIVNESERTMADFDLHWGELRFPSVPDGLIAQGRPRGRVASSLNEFIRIPVAWEGGQMVACVESFEPPLRFGFGSSEDPEQRKFPVVLRGGVHALGPHGVFFPPHGYPRIESGETLKVSVSFRFAPSEVAWQDLTSDLEAAFLERHPSVVEWPDRRPVAAIFGPSDRESISESNPRGWFGDPRLSTVTAAGRELFRLRMLDFGERSVRVMQETGSQGMIFWNLEGEAHDAITYVGDPRMLGILAPEMDAVADEFFELFRVAGLRTGLTIRPTQVYYNDDSRRWAHGTGSHMDARNPLDNDYEHLRPREIPQWRFFPVVERMSDKIQYAKDRWGCTIFYIDTNGLYAPIGHPVEFKWILLEAQVLRELMERHPDVLLVPEFRNGLASWAYSAPYDQLDFTGRARTPGSIRRVYPDAFVLNAVMNSSDDIFWERADELTRTLRDGDIFIHHGWWMPNPNRFVRAFYEARELPIASRLNRLYIWLSLLRWDVADEPAVEFLSHEQSDPRLSGETPQAQVSAFIQPGLRRALVLAYNTADEDRDVVIRLDRGALRLRSNAEVKVVVREMAEEILAAGEAREMAEAASVRSMGGEADPFDDEFMDLLEVVSGEKDRWTPRLEGNILTVPLRAQSHEVLRIE